MVDVRMILTSCLRDMRFNRHGVYVLDPKGVEFIQTTFKVEDVDSCYIGLDSIKVDGSDKSIHLHVDGAVKSLEMTSLEKIVSQISYV